MHNQFNTTRKPEGAHSFPLGCKLCSNVLLRSNQQMSRSISMIYWCTPNVTPKCFSNSLPTSGGRITSEATQSISMLWIYVDYNLSSLASIVRLDFCALRHVNGFRLRWVGLKHVTLIWEQHSAYKRRKFCFWPEKLYEYLNHSYFPILEVYRGKYKSKPIPLQSWNALNPLTPNDL
jgi:hypothetical protein